MNPRPFIPFLLALSLSLPAWTQRPPGGRPGGGQGPQAQHGHVPAQPHPPSGGMQRPPQGMPRQQPTPPPPGATQPIQPRMQHLPAPAGQPGIGAQHRHYQPIPGPTLGPHAGGSRPPYPGVQHRHIPTQPPPHPGLSGLPLYDVRPDGGIDRSPHVRGGHWYGNDRPGDPRYRMDPRFRYGHYGWVGPRWRHHIWHIDWFNRYFWLPGGYWFQVAQWDWDYCHDWCWSCGNDFVIYDDYDHPGWYLLLNLRTGRFVHIFYMGA